SYGPDTDARLLEELGLPLFVKPASLGSSVGISKVREYFELPDAMALAFKHGDKAVVEEGLTAREIEVAVLDGPSTSIPGEIVSADWYDYEAKYADDATQLLVPAPLTVAESDEVRDLAGRAFEVLGVRGLARVDFFYEEGGRGFLINELNTMPGCTSRSMFPVLWEATGVPNVELFDRLVRSALP
ncbi:MAG: ATP-grasp domain-containing protein, partial [Acidimicrobiia bacterium]